jgi:hypothetical protein
MFRSSKRETPTTGGSGVRLKKSVTHANVAASDPMNLDEFILSSSVGSPAGISTSDSRDNAGGSTNAVVSAIPIKMREEWHASIPTDIPAASVLHPLHNHKRQNELDCVQKHVRKTSADKRRVCIKTILNVQSTLTIRTAPENACRIFSSNPTCCEHNDFRRFRLG